MDIEIGGVMAYAAPNFILKKSRKNAEQHTRQGRLSYSPKPCLFCIGTPPRQDNKLLQTIILLFYTTYCVYSNYFVSLQRKSEGETPAEITQKL